MSDTNPELRPLEALPLEFLPEWVDPSRALQFTALVRSQVLMAILSSVDPYFSYWSPPERRFEFLVEPTPCHGGVAYPVLGFPSRDEDVSPFTFPFGEARSDGDVYSWTLGTEWVNQRVLRRVSELRDWCRRRERHVERGSAIRTAVSELEYRFLDWLEELLWYRLGRHGRRLMDHQVIILSPRPEIELMGCPALGVQGATGRVCGTTGAWATRRGQLGVTAARHCVAGASQGQQVTLLSDNGARRMGSVVADDVITDSCFVECGVNSVNFMPKPLRGVSPREGETHTVIRHTGETRSAEVTGWSADLLVPHEWSQRKVYTAAVTEPGDSGAALYDSAGQVVGFAFARTALGSSKEFSSWIWADSVWDALGLDR